MNHTQLSRAVSGAAAVWTAAAGSMALAAPARRSSETEQGGMVYAPATNENAETAENGAGSVPPYWPGQGGNLQAGVSFNAAGGAAPVTGMQYPSVPVTLKASADRHGQPADWFVYLVVALVFAGSGLALASIRRALLGSGFSLGDAVSEETEVTVFENGRPMLGADGAPLSVTVMRSSISRVIALCGSVLILLLYVGFGVFTLFYYGSGGGVPQGTQEVAEFLLSGMTLFAPYTINKFSSLFESFTGKTRGGSGGALSLNGSGALDVGTGARGGRRHSGGSDMDGPAAG